MKTNAVRLLDTLGIRYELREYAFKIGQAHQLCEIGGRRVGQDAALGDDDDAVAYLLHDFQHMRDVDDCLAFRGK